MKLSNATGGNPDAPSTARKVSHAYRKRPVVIEARQFLSVDFDNGPELARWCGGTFRWAEDDGWVWIEIPTLEGTMIAKDGDWIIRGVKGEFYPCKPEIFVATYEAVDDNAH